MIIGTFIPSKKEKGPSFWEVIASMEVNLKKGQSFQDNSQRRREQLGGKHVAFRLHFLCCVRPLPRPVHAFSIIALSRWKSASVS